MLDIADLTFEQSFQALEETVGKLEAGNLTLQESLKLFEYGQALAARCSTLLDEAELKIQVLGPDGEGPFDLAQ
jgi:exodeoxyribonuclease VII small subunit